MPTAIAPTTEKAICHPSEGMRCFTMPCVAFWSPCNRRRRDEGDGYDQLQPHRSDEGDQQVAGR